MYMRTQYIDGTNIFSQKNKIKKLQMAIDVNYKSFLKIKVPQFYFFFFGRNQGIVNNLKISNKYRPNPPSGGSV